MTKHSKDRSENKKDLERTIDAGRTEQVANADRGGTTDMDSTIRKTHRTGTGSGMATKRFVTGSDFDGQVKDQ